MPDIPTIGNLDTAILALQAAGLMLLIQFTKGKLFRDDWTPAIVVGLIAVVAAADILAPVKAQQFVNLFLVLFGGATGGWSLVKTASGSPVIPPRNPPGAP